MPFGITQIFPHRHEPEYRRASADPIRWQLYRSPGTSQANGRVLLFCHSEGSSLATAFAVCAKSLQPENPVGTYIIQLSPSDTQTTPPGNTIAHILRPVRACLWACQILGKIYPRTLFDYGRDRARHVHTNALRRVHPKLRGVEFEVRSQKSGVWIPRGQAGGG